MKRLMLTGLVILSACGSKPKPAQSRSEPKGEATDAQRREVKRAKLRAIASVLDGIEQEIQTYKTQEEQK